MRCLCGLASRLSGVGAAVLLGLALLAAPTAAIADGGGGSTTLGCFWCTNGCGPPVGGSCRTGGSNCFDCPPFSNCDCYINGNYCSCQPVSTAP